MVWSRLENGRVPYIQVCVDRKSKWSASARGRQRSGWMDVKFAVGSREMRVEAERQFAKDKKEWRALVHM